MTKYYVYFLAEYAAEFAREANGEYPKPFDTAKAAISWAKSRADNTDGTFAMQIIGFDDHSEPVYSKMISAKKNSKGQMRGRVIQ